MPPVALTSFYGINLPEDAQEVGFRGAIDLINVDLDRKGRLRTRDGYAKVTSSAGTNAYDSLHAFYPGTGTFDRLVAGAGTRLEAINMGTGAVAHSSTAPTVSPHQFATFGGSAGVAVYIANGTDQVRKYTTAGGFTSPAGLAAVTGKFLAVQSPDNRLVSAKGDRVSFSGPDTPETFGAADWVDITPGDGESITGIAGWNQMVFVFKETKFAVFTGNGTDTTGGSLFNYRIVDSPAGTGAGSGLRCTATPAGVVFADSSGVYLTTGGPPVSISSGIQPLFDGYAPQYATVDWIATPTGICSKGRRVFVGYNVHEAGAVDPLPSSLYVLVFDLDAQQWMLWDSPASSLAVVRNNGSDLATVAFADGSGSKHIMKFGVDTVTDDGAAVGWQYQTGFDDLGSNERKVVRFAELWGSGSVTVKVAVDHGVVDTGSSVTLGSAPTVDSARQSVARRGRLFSLRLSGSGPVAVNRALLYVREVESEGSR